MSLYSGSQLPEPEDVDWILNMLFAKLFIENTITTGKLNSHIILEIVFECLLKFQCFAISIISPSKQTETQCNGTHELT